MSHLTIFNQPSHYGPRFQNAYEYLNNVRLEIRGLRSAIELEVNDIVCVVGISELTNILLTRIGVCCLLPRRSCGFIPNRTSSPNSNVLVIDAGNSIDVYQYVEFGRQYGLDTRQVLQRVVVTRVFTIYQLVHLIVYNLPKMIHKFNVKLILIPDLFDMFIQDQIDIKEAKSLIKEIVDAILILSRKNNVLFLTSILLNKLLSISDLYYKTLLPLFNKSIEIIQSKSSERFTMKINEKFCKYVTNYVTNNRKYFISKNDLLIVSK
jgi:hypothetical protein